ncbi:MAG: nicotinate-nucleotide--dimethylbenzimidazole phosphoribosyltransferase, partial [Isosphaeraceae bacterium]
MTSLGSQDIWNHLDSLTKPARSLGRLEELAARLCEVQQTLFPRTTPRRIVLFAGDHGVTASGVTAWPSEVTRLMVKNIRAGGAASTVLARQTQTDAMLIDVGVLGDVCADEGQAPAERPGIRFRRRRIRAGTRDLALEPALLLGEFEAAIHVGRDEAREAASDGMRVVAAGEMGIGNTTPSAC